MIKQAVRLARRLGELGVAWSRDLLLCSYSREQVRVQSLIGFMQPFSGEALITADQVRLHKQNHFDLLGSGWRDWSLVSNTNLPNRANRRHSRRVRALISESYRAIDWHLEPRADYRWPARRWSRWIQPARPAGVDIKLPWELSRMQHLLPLALSALSEEEVLGERAADFRDQVLDFIAANPPRFGVNWRTPMDVAIRAANWVLVFSVYRAAGYEFDEDFEQVLGGSLLDHGRHVVNFMEWDPHWRGNHYLANQCGLVFIAAALPSSLETDAWLAFSVQELHNEGLRQINADGSVFEASTGYHRLSLEMVVYASAAVLGLMATGEKERLRAVNSAALCFKKPLAKTPMDLYPLPGSTQIETPFSPAYFKRLAAAAAFTKDITMGDRRIPLIGDNDSGRFAKVRVVSHSMDWADCTRRYANLKGVSPIGGLDVCPVEEQRDIRYLGGLLSGLLNDPSLLQWADVWTVERQFIRALSGELSASLSLPRPPFAIDSVPLGKLPAHAKQLRIDLPAGVGLDVQCRAYTDFGLFLFVSSRLFLAIRCGPIGQDGFGGHAHNDQLSLVLQVDGKDLIMDPGVYRYTVDVEERRRYRSVQAHFAPRVGNMEPGSLELGPWRLGDEAQAMPEYFAECCFQGQHQGFGRAVHRRVWLQGDQLLIADWGDDGLEVESPASLYAQLNDEGVLLPFCPAYGVQHA